jgi:hypothetical protein
MRLDSMPQTHVLALVIVKTVFYAHLRLEIVRRNPVVERTELTVGKTRPCTPRSRQTLAAGARPHRQNAIILPSGCQNYGAGFKDEHFTGIQAKAHGAASFAAVRGQYVNDTDPVNEFYTEPDCGFPQLKQIVEIDSCQSPRILIVLVEIIYTVRTDAAQL